MDFFLAVALITAVVYGLYYGLLLVDITLRLLLAFLLATVYYAAVATELLFTWLDRRYLQ